MVISSNVYDHIRANNIKTVLLVLAMPFVLIAIVYAVFFLALINDPNRLESSYYLLKVYGVPVGLIGFVWGVVAYFSGTKVMMNLAGARLAADDKKNQHIYRAVENVALAAGLPTPKIYLIDDESLNAFATGHSPESAAVALTTGLVKKLDPLELQAVIAHEMGHIGNRDIRLNTMIIVGVGACELMGRVILRMVSDVKRDSRSQSKEASRGAGALLLVGFALILFSYIVAPIIYLAVSRTREFAADAASAYITRNPAALASALKKIAADGRVEALNGMPSMEGACIFDPREKRAIGGSTHPPVEERIARLNQMSGLFQ